MENNVIFNDISSKQWKQKIQFELNGKDYQTLIWEGIDGVKIKPFYHFDEDDKKTPIFQSNRTFSIGHKIFVTHIEKTLKQIEKYLKKGVESFSFFIPNDTIDILEIVQYTQSKNIPIFLEFGFINTAYFQRVNHIKTINTTLFIDPIHQLTQSGNWFKNKDADFYDWLSISTQTAAPIIIVKINGYQNAGANIIQQLAFAMAHLHEYLSLNQSKNIKVYFEVAIGGNYFFEIAKLKALRWLFESLSEEYNLNPNCQIIAIPSKRNKTIFQQENNLVRSTTECLSAVLGGADTIFHLPADFMFKKDNSNSNHLSINQLLILKNESNITDNINTSNEGFYIQSLVNEMAQKSLLLFKEIERKGGFLHLLKTGFIQNKIEEIAMKEQMLFNDGHEKLIGINLHAQFDENISIEMFPFAKITPRKTIIKPIIEYRISESLEKLHIKL